MIGGSRHKCHNFILQISAVGTQTCRVGFRSGFKKNQPRKSNVCVFSMLKCHFLKVCIFRYKIRVLSELKRFLL